MINLPKQLISEVTDNLSSNVMSFMETDEYSIIESPKKAVEDTFIRYMSESTQPDILKKNMRNERKQRKRKKENWYNRVLREYESRKIDSPQNPMFSVYMAYNSLGTAEKEKLGWNRPLEEVISGKLAEIKEWKDDDESYLMDFACLSMFKPQKIYTDLQSDIYKDVFQYLKDKYNLSINSFQKLYTDTLIENPIFGEKKEVMHLESSDEDGNALVEKLILSPDSIFYTIVKKNETTASVKSLGPQDLELIQQGIFNYITDSFYTDRTVINKLRVYAQILCRSKYNRTYVKKAAQALLSYPDISYKAQSLKNNVTTKAYVLFDDIEIKNPPDFESTEDDPYSPDADVIVHFGNRLYQEILQAQIIGITQDSYNKVNSELAHMLAPVLQMQRTILTKELPAKMEPGFSIDAAMTKSHEYMFFASGIRLTGKKKDNISRLRMAIEEFINADLYVKSLRLSNNIFTITYYPLSDDELADIQINKHHNAPKQISMMDLIQGQGAQPVPE